MSSTPGLSTSHTALALAVRCARGLVVQTRASTKPGFLAAMNNLMTILTIRSDDLAGV